MKLYKIAEKFNDILELINEDGELNQDTVQALDDIESEFEEKAIAVASYVKSLEAEQEAIQQAINSMRARQDSLSTKSEQLREYLQFNLQRLSINEISSSPYFKIKIKQCPESIDVFDETAIPAEFVREKTVTSIDKIKIKEAIKDGIDVPGASIQRKLKLEIK